MKATDEVAVFVRQLFGLPPLVQLSLEHGGFDIPEGCTFEVGIGVAFKSFVAR